jgi:hypothetical protein
MASLKDEDDDVRIKGLEIYWAVFNQVVHDLCILSVAIQPSIQKFLKIQSTRYQSPLMNGGSMILKIR